MNILFLRSRSKNEKTASMPDQPYERKSISSFFLGERSKTLLRSILDNKNFGFKSAGPIFYFYGTGIII